MKFFTAVLVFLLALSGLAYPIQTVKIGDTPSGATLLSQDESGLTLKVDVGEINFSDISTPSGQFVLMTAEGLGNSQKIGEPRLPVLNRLISIPYGCELAVDVAGSDYQEISLAGLNLNNPLMPVQPPMSKSADPATVPFEYNQNLYQRSGYYTLPQAETQILGEMRAVRLALVSISPVEYNPVAKTLRVYKSLTVHVNYLHPDWTATREIWQRLDSPVFDPVYENIFNYGGQTPMLLNDHTRYPIKYVIVSARMFEAQLQPFIQWKIKKGFNVIVGYTDIIGTTNTAIKNYLHNLYDAGSPSDPAPSFILLVGDAQQIPPFQFTGHISDLSFAEYTNDTYPEVYYGRFSAQTTAQLQPQIDKTLEYERYLMPDPSYLNQVTMLAGVDANYGQVWANGQINYGTSQYFNSAHGITSHTWLYPASSGNVESAIIATINQGIGYINYTAHGSHDGWADPSLSTSDVNALTNAHKYFLSVGNCCQTSTFGTDYSTPSQGETWLQAANKGAVGYIGASDYSYWDEDYFWGVGFRSSVVEHPTYDAARLGAYDGAFHTHGESVVKHYTTNDAMLYCGNLAVDQSNSSMKAYYWQVYHLMGDPSVMTYFGIPVANNVIHAGSMQFNATSYTVQAAPGSYVGISLAGVLHGAAYIDSTGTVDVSMTPFTGPGSADIVVTSQNKIPYTGTIEIFASGPYVTYDSSTVNDNIGNNNGIIDCGEAIVLGVRLKNSGPDTAFGVIATLACIDSFVTITDNTESYGAIPGNNGLLNKSSAFAFNVAGRTPDNYTLRFNLTITDNALHTWNSSFTLIARAPIVAYDSSSINDSAGNNNGLIDCGEPILLGMRLKNVGPDPANGVTATLACVDTFVTITDNNESYGTIAANNGTVNMPNAYAFNVSNRVPDGRIISFQVAMTDSYLHRWNSTFSLPFHAPNLVYISTQVYDGTGNGNGILDPGETAQLVVTLHNGGSGQATTITGIMSETDTYISLSDPNGSFGSIGVGLIGNNSGDMFTIAASPSCPQLRAVTLTLSLISNGGRPATVTIPIVVGDRTTIFSDDFSTNQGWTGLGGAGEWTIGAATGGTGSDGHGGPDPATDHSPSGDNRLLGTDLTSGTGGDYNPSLAQTYYVTSPTINCSNFTNVQLSFYRWLGIERSQYDHASLEAFNGTTWVTIFQNDTITIDESAWDDTLLNVSSYADHNANFKIRFGIGPTDGGWEFCGWNIDDILVRGFQQAPPGRPQLSFSANALSDTLVQGDSSSQTFKIYNRGSANLQITFSCVADWVRFTGTQITVPSNDSANYTIMLKSIGLMPDQYVTSLSYASNDTANATGNIPVSMLVDAPVPVCDYVLCDINNNGALNGVDVVFGVSYFKGGIPPTLSCECPIGSGIEWFVAGDANGSCNFNGLDMTYLVAFFKGGTAPISCPDCPATNALKAPRPQPLIPTSATQSMKATTE